MNVVNPCLHSLSGPNMLLVKSVSVPFEGNGLDRSHFGSRDTLGFSYKAGLFATLAKVRFQ